MGKSGHGSFTVLPRCSWSSTRLTVFFERSRNRSRYSITRTPKVRPMNRITHVSASLVVAVVVCVVMDALTL